MYHNCNCIEQNIFALREKLTSTHINNLFALKMSIINDYKEITKFTHVIQHTLRNILNEEKRTQIIAVT